MDHALGRMILWGLLASMTAVPQAASAAEEARSHLAEEDVGISYEVVIQGVDSESLRDLLRGVSNTVAFKDELPPSLGVLERRVQGDIEEFQRALRSRSYYGAQVQTAIDESRDPVRVVFKVDKGPAYRIQSVDITTSRQAKEAPRAPPPREKRPVTEPKAPNVEIEPLQVIRSPEVEIPSPESLGLSIGKPGEAGLVIDAQEELLSRLKKKGRPFPKIAERKVIVNHADHSMHITLVVDPGPKAKFGEVTIEGLETVDEDHVRNKIPWREGESFDVAMLRTARNNLTQTGLFSKVRISTGDAVSKSGHLPMTVELKERKHRTVKLGAGYSTDKGIGGKASWEHRNFLGGGERLFVELVASQIAYSGEGSFRMPEFLQEDQSLIFSSRLAQESPDAFESRSFTNALFVERQISEQLSVGAGPSFKFSRVEQQDETDEFALASLPGYLDWDTSDDLLNPTRGGRLKVNLAPFYDVMNGDAHFFRTQVGYRRYFEISESPSLIVAGRGVLGSIMGSSKGDVPADERFYAGGGGSIRGYSFQSVGPLEDDEPMGGRSLLEMSLELRYRMTKNIGLVAFLDGGSVFESEYPDFDEEVRWGTGLGFRYFTPIGPLRLDVGVPLDRRDEVDDPFELYMSIGQAF